MNKAYHYVPQYFLDPVHRISVFLVGAGGTGSQMLSALARIDAALRSLGRKGLFVRVYDPDTVEEPNIGRQLFTWSDLGTNKAECLVSRFNRIYGNDWEAEPRAFSPSRDELPNIVITCVDNVRTRMEIGKRFRRAARDRAQNENYPFYWLDLGNGQRTGQAFLGSNPVKQPENAQYDTVPTLPTIAEQVDLDGVDERDSGPSCSLAEALTRQDLFVNSVLAMHAGHLLWSLLTDVALDVRGFWLNLESCRCAPVQVSTDDAALIPSTKTRSK